jgi:hypothetical protein
MADFSHIYHLPHYDVVSAPFQDTNHWPNNIGESMDVELAAICVTHFTAHAHFSISNIQHFCIN